MRNRVPIVFSVIALLVVTFADTPIGSATTQAVRVALFAKNAGAVNGIKASRTPKPGQLVPLASNGRLPARVIPRVDAASVDGLRASSTPAPGELLPLGANGTFQESVVPLDSTTKAPNIAARVYRSSDLPIPPGGTDIPFDSVAFDTHSLYNAALPTRLTAPVSGIYMVTAGIGWEHQEDFTNAGANRACAIVSVPDGINARIQQPPAKNLWQDFSFLFRLRAGDWVHLGCNHDNATTLAILGGINGAPSTFLSMYWVAPG